MSRSGVSCWKQRENHTLARVVCLNPHSNTDLNTHNAYTYERLATVDLDVSVWLVSHYTVKHTWTCNSIIHSYQNPTQNPLPHLVYDSDSEPDSDGELHPVLPWREVHDIPSFQLREAIGNQQPTENDSFSLWNDTSPLDIIYNNARDRLWGDWVGCVSPYGLDIQ